MDSSTSENLIIVEPLELRLYNDQTGQVIKAFTEASVRAEHKQNFPIHLEVDTNFVTEGYLYLYYETDDDSDKHQVEIRDLSHNGGRPFLVVEAKSLIKIAGMDKRTLSKLVFTLNGQVIKPSWYSEKYALGGSTFNYSAIIRVP
jgi:hypothetical protein